MENLLRPRLSGPNRVMKKPTPGASGLIDKKINSNEPTEPNPKKDSGKSRNVFQDLSYNPTQGPKQGQSVKKGNKLAFTLFEDEDDIELVHKSVEKVHEDIPLVFKDINENLIETKLCLEESFDKIATNFCYPAMSKQTFNKRKKRLEQFEAELFKEM